MTWQSFKQAPAYPVLVSCPGGLPRAFSTYYFGITGTFWAVTGEFTRWGGHAAAAGRPQRTVGYYQLIHLEGSPLTRIDAG